MILYLLNRNLPSANRVTLLAIRSQLAPVDIRVTVLAALANIGEHRLYVALRARDRCVHAAQRVLRLVVVELRDSPYGLPGICSVAVQAGHTEIPVRTASHGSLRARIRRQAGACQNGNSKHFEFVPSTPHSTCPFVTVR